MRERILLKDNKGATLVLVIVAMFFIGLIASIVLTVTVGNAKNTKTTKDSSENFYSAEGILDDLKMYLKKLAVSSATDAYGKTLEKAGTGVSLNDEFDKNFKDYLVDKLQNALNEGNPFGVTQTMDTDFVKNNITFERPGNITIKYGNFVVDGSEYILKDVVITLVDENGYESVITTDIKFSAKMPETGIMGSSTEFNYGIDHFIMISKKSINSSNNNLTGNIVGSIYARDYLNLKTDAATTDVVNLSSEYVIVGKDINIDKGKVTISPVSKYLKDEAGNYQLSTITTINSIPVSGENIYKVAGAGTQVNNNVWCDSMKIGDAEVTIKSGKDFDNVEVFPEINLRKNLELNGQNSSFTANGGKVYGYSSGNATYLESEPVSSAIILNGLGANLDLSDADALCVAGTAYTALSDIDGVYDAYKISASDTPSTGINYFTQGESITYRALQALYLIPGDYITGVGHNPMKKSEEPDIDPDNVSVPSGLSGLLNAGVYKRMEVRYVGTESYVYWFWDFSSVDNAVKYFNEVTTGSTKRYSGLLDKQASVLGYNTGSIKLPTSNVGLKGNAVVFNGSKFTPKGKSTLLTEMSGKNEDVRNSLLATAQKTAGTAEKDNLIDNMFKKGLENTLASEDYTGTLWGPLKPIAEGDGTDIVQYTYDTTKYSDRTYVLKTGPNVSLNPDANKTYIIITPGDVNIGAGAFRGLIIAGGNINLATGLNMECLGMIQRTRKVNGVEEEETVSTPRTLSEFRALLNVVLDDTVDSANTRLRSIFGVADSSTTGNLGEDGDFVSVETVEWKRN